MFIRHTAKLSLTLLLSCLLSTVSLPASSAGNEPLDPQWLRLADAGPSITKSQAARAAQKKHGGKVLNVAHAGNNYRVKLLKDSGKVVIVMVDGKTGNVK